MHLGVMVNNCVRTLGMHYANKCSHNDGQCRHVCVCKCVSGWMEELGVACPNGAGSVRDQE